MVEQRKKDISKEYIKEKVLNKDLVEIQESLHKLKSSITSGENDDINYFGLDKIMNILFNSDGNVRNKFGFELNKMTSIMYMMISSEGKKNLDLLYNELERSKSESELKKNLGMELLSLQSEIINHNTSSDNNHENTDNGNNHESTGNGSNQGNINHGNETKIERLNNDENFIYNQAKLYGVTDKRQIAYILATVKGECGFKNIKEHQGEKRDYGKDGYYGRGYVQITHKSNYRKFTNIIKKSGLNFRDNNGNIIKGKNVDLVKNPNLILQSNDLSAFILVYGMKNGSFTGKSLDDYINNRKCDYKNARRIINGMDHASDFSKNANDYLSKLGGKKEKINNSNILVGPELKASNRDKIAGIGNSIMCGIQGLDNKNKIFKNMCGIEGKTTVNHPDGFKSKNDVKRYIKNNPNVKSFMFYFGGNTSNNKQTLSDISKWSKWFQEEGVQPVLCTCIGVDSHVTKNGKKWLKSLNNDILSLGREKKYPVIDFAKIDKNIQKGSDKIHPTGSGYQKMRDEIDKCLV